MQTNEAQALDEFSKALNGEGFQTRMLEKTAERPYDVLLAFVPQDEHPAGGVQLELSFIPGMDQQLAGLSLMQFFTGLANDLSPNTLSELQKAIISVNRFCPLVGFGILSQPAMLYFRHVLMLPKTVEDSVPLVVQTTWLISYLVDVFGNNLTQVADGRASLAEAFREHPFGHLLT